ncbi:MAG: IS200/IS605 family transposase [Dehalococcoidia bacterium]
MSPEHVYHVWFTTKGRRWLLTGEMGDTVKVILGEIAREQGINLLECQPMVDHVHVLVGACSSVELSWIMKLLKGRSSYELSLRNPELKVDTGTNSFWQRGFAARAVPETQLDTVRWYIRTQDRRLEKYER